MNRIYKKHLILTISLSVVLLFFGRRTLAQENPAVPAPGTPPLKIGVVDVLKVYNAWEVQQRADAEFQPLRDKLQEKDKNITAMKDELRRQQSVLKQEQIAQKEAAIKKEERDLRDQVEELSAQIEEKAKKITKELDNKLKDIYASLAEKEGYTIILEKRAVRYSKPGMDLTEKITEILNKKEKPVEPPKPVPGKTAPVPSMENPKKTK